MALYRRHIKLLTRLLLRHLQSILRIKLRWAGHVRKMPESRLPKAILYSELASGNWNQGGQKLRYMDQLKRHMKICGIDPESWEEKADDRPTWRNLVRQSITAIENMRSDRSKASHYRRHTVLPDSTSVQSLHAPLSLESRAGGSSEGLPTTLNAVIMENDGRPTHTNVSHNASKRCIWKRPYPGCISLTLLLSWNVYKKQTARVSSNK